MNEHFDLPLQIPATPILELGDVHVYSFATNELEASQHVIPNVLSKEENSRLQRFVFERDQQLYFFAHSLTRIFIGKYLDINPVDIEYSYGHKGKPFLLYQDEHPLYFNLSHTDGCILLAFSLEEPVGVDVEKIRHNLDIDGISKNYFTEHEIDELHALDLEHRYQAFFYLWTRKEALLKCNGNGLSQPLNSVEIVNAQCRLNDCIHRFNFESHWWIQSFGLGKDYIGAVAKENKIQQLYHWYHPIIELK